MTEKKPKLEVWYKCYSKSKKLMYYWNCDSLESIWEEDSEELSKRPNVTIIDKTDDMKSGKTVVYKPVISKTTSSGMPSSETSSDLKMSMSETSNEDKDDARFDDSLNAFYESPSSSFINGSQGSYTSNNTNGGSGRRNSDPSSVVKEDLMNGRRSSDSPLSEAMAEKKNSLNNASSHLPKSPDLTPETSFALPRFEEKGNTTAPLSTQQLSNGDSQPTLGKKKFTIPLRKVCNRSPDKKFERRSQIPSPPPPLQVLPSTQVPRARRHLHKNGLETTTSHLKNPLSQSMKRIVKGNTASVAENKTTLNSSSAMCGLKRTKISTESASPQSEAETGVPSNTSSDEIGLGSGTVITKTVSPVSKGRIPPVAFDAREVLNRRRLNKLSTETTSRPSRCGAEDLRMDWEECSEGSFQGQSSRAASTSLAMSNLQYRPLVIVCDTNVLMHYLDLVKDLLAGTLLGIPCTVVIPVQVIRELDDKKHYNESPSVHNARAAVKLINNTLQSSLRYPLQNNLVIQEGANHKKIVKKGMELEKNDDFVMNCVLQEDKTHGSDKTVILLTADQNLQIIASSWKVKALSPKTLKPWAREYKEKIRRKELGIDVNEADQLSFALSLSRGGTSGRMSVSSSANSLPRSDQPIEKMEVDTDSLPLASTSTAPSTCSVSPSIKPEAPRQEHTKFYVESLTDELFQFLINIIDEANQRLYGELKRHAMQPQRSETLLKCLSEVIRRWETLTEKHMSQDVNRNIRKIIELIKKYNKEMEEFTSNDIHTLFTSSQTLGREFLKLYPKVTNLFLQRVIMLIEEWEQKTLSGNTGATYDGVDNDDDPQPADVALQNIINCMKSDYETWKRRVQSATGTNREDMKERLRLFCAKVTNIRQALQFVLDSPQSSLDHKDESIFDVLKLTTAFQTDSGNLLSFDFTIEDIVTLFKEDNHRTKVKLRIGKILRLQGDIMDLLAECENDEELDF